MEEVLVLGGNGLLGHATAKELVDRGYDVTSLALPRKPGQSDVPEGVHALWNDLNDMTDEELLEVLKGKHAVFYAIGADERTIPKAPASAFFYDANVLPTQRLARLAREAGVKKFVLYGSYTAEMGERWPDLGYRTRNGYPRTRLLQEEVAEMEGKGEMDVMTLRLPYIFGLVEGQRPLWQYKIDQVSAPDAPVVLPGSTSAVTVDQVADAAVGAMEHGADGEKYPINAYDLTYEELTKLACEAVGRDPEDVVVAPLEAMLPAYEAMQKEVDASGLEHGVALPDTAIFQSREAVSAPEETAKLKIREDDVPGAIREVFKWCVDNPVPADEAAQAH